MRSQRVEQAQEKIGLVREDVVNRAVGDAGRFSDIVDGCTAEAALAKHTRCSLKNMLPA
jgi:hypothetical protein